MGGRFGRSLFYPLKHQYNVQSQGNVNGHPGNYKCSPNKDEHFADPASTTTSNHKLLRNGKFELCRCDTISNASVVIEYTDTNTSEHGRDSETGVTEHGRDSNTGASEHSRNPDTGASEHVRDSDTSVSEHNREAITVAGASERSGDAVTGASEHDRNVVASVSEHNTDTVTGERDRNSLSDASDVDRNAEKSASEQSNETGTDVNSSSNKIDGNGVIIRYRERSRHTQPYVCSRLSYLRVHGQKCQNVHPDIIQWKKGNRLGRGAFGTVWLGLTATGELIAVKQVHMSEDPEAQKDYDNIVREVSLLRMVYHRNIVR
ncbi:hypothetical protein LSAT2_026168 [Lamellibrachia satsuma]|nr:hypothetical protein LSAT2_026168 [Lamellibrachia satsuma]